MPRSLLHKPIRCFLIVIITIASLVLGTAPKGFSQNYLREADSLYLWEDYTKSYTVRQKHLQTLAPKSPAYLQQQAKQWVTQFYLSAQEPKDTQLLTRAIATLEPVTSEYSSEVYVDASIALANYYRGTVGEEKCLEMLKKLEAKPAIQRYLNASSKVSIYYTYAGIYDNKDATYLLAIDYYKKAVELAEQPNYANKNALALLYNDMAIIYDYIGQKDKTIAYFTKAHEIWWRYYKYWYINSNITALCNVVSNHSDYGTHQKATIYLDTLFLYFDNVKKATANKTLNFRTPEQNQASEIFILLTAIRCYSAANKEKLMLAHLQKLQQKVAQVPTAKREQYLDHLIEGYTSVALYYRELNDFLNAKKYFTLGGNHTHNAFYAMKADANLGILYNMWQKPADALPHINAALNYFSGTNKTRTSYFGLQATKADILHKLQQYGSAVQALDTLYKYNAKKTITGTPLTYFSLNTFAEQVNNTQIGVLTKTGHVYAALHQQTKQKQHLQTAHHFYLLAAQLFKTYYTREFYSNYLFSLNQEITKGLLKTGLLLGKSADVPALLNITENNTSQQVWKKFIGKYRENIGVPDSILSKRNSLVNQIALLEIAASNNKKLPQLKTELAAIDKTIEHTTKTHYTFANNNFDVASLQTKMSNKQLMVRYIATDSMLFAFAITNQAIQLFRLASTTEVRQALATLKPTITAQNQAYLPTVSALYRLLLQPVLSTYEANELVIIPDGEVLTLPFEILYNAGTKKYLVQEKILSYSYALPLYFLQQYSTAVSSKATVTFAPSYPSLPSPLVLATRANMYNLVNAATEAEAISKLYNGVYFGTSTATVNNFIQSLGKYNIYHLAMHAWVDSTAPENSSLIFYNNAPLYFKQLYQLNFPAAMVVLSACNTGMGAMELGEGVQSLSRALTYSGVQSAVYSLWEVPDKETSEIMIEFYENLSKGQSKSLALANAKRTFLLNNPLKQHPFYWAGFVLNGNTEAIGKSYASWYTALAAAIAALIGFMVWRKWKRN